MSTSEAMRRILAARGSRSDRSGSTLPRGTIPANRLQGGLPWNSPFFGLGPATEAPRPAVASSLPRATTGRIAGLSALRGSGSSDRRPPVLVVNRPSSATPTSGSSNLRRPPLIQSNRGSTAVSSGRRPPPLLTSARPGGGKRSPPMLTSSRPTAPVRSPPMLTANRPGASSSGTRRPPVLKTRTEREWEALQKLTPEQVEQLQWYQPAVAEVVPVTTRAAEVVGQCHSARRGRRAIPETSVVLDAGQKPVLVVRVRGAFRRGVLALDRQGARRSLEPVVEIVRHRSRRQARSP
jgi:hypothetical protein